MPPFLAFRLWLREGPSAERALAAAAAAVVLALVVLALVPVAGESSSPAGLAVELPAPAGSTGPTGASSAAAGARAHGTTGGASAPGATGSSAVGGSAAAGGTRATGAGGVAAGGGTGQSSATPGSPGCAAARTSSAPGVTASTVLFDVANISLAGPIGNSTFDVRPDLGKIAQALADDINEHGGLACGRKVVLKQYDVNPLDANDSQSKCLQMASDHPFLVFNVGAYLTPAARQCFVQNKVLEMSSTQIDYTELQQSYPYLFSVPAVAEQMVDAAVAGFAKRGIFSGPKFKKLGLFEDGCDPPVNKRIDEDLARAGVMSSQVTKYVLDCNVASPPNQIEQGVVQQKLANATHVLLASSETNDENYVRIANGQNFHPQYLVSDYGSNTSGAGTENWGSAFNGAVGITTTRVGEFSSGVHNPQEVECDKVMRRHGVPGVQHENKDTSAMGSCDSFWFVRQAMAGAGDNPTQLSFLQSLSTMGLFRSADLGDGLFNRRGKLTGGDFEREIVYRGSCSCWHIVDRTMRPVQ